MKQKIIQTSDGSKTIYLPELDEHYHSVNGAFTESEHVYINMGYCLTEQQSPVVFEVGFGTGLNCILTAIQAEQKKQKTYYYTIDNFPLEKSILNKLNHNSLFNKEEKEIFEKIHSCEWNKTTPISDFFYLHKIESRLQDFKLSLLKKFDVVYFDAFGPDKQPEMWTPDIFASVFEQCSPGAIFVTYSAKGEVRRRLEKAGFTMERLPGPPGKKQMLRGIKEN